MPYLTFDDLLTALLLRVGGCDGAENTGGQTNRRQRVPQFVSQGGEKFVLATI